jgi:hypothetical protein
MVIAADGTNNADEVAPVAVVVLESAEPVCPVTQDAPETVRACPFPDESAAVVPVFSFKLYEAYAAGKLGGAAVGAFIMALRAEPSTA